MGNGEWCIGLDPGLIRQIKDNLNQILTLLLQVPQDALTALLADKEALTAVLLRHVVPGAIKAKDVPLGSTTLGTAGGEEIVVTNAPSGVSIKSSAGSANVIIFDVLASNGVVHAVDSVF